MTMKTSVVIYSFYKKEFQERVEIEIKKKKILWFCKYQKHGKQIFYNALTFSFLKLP